MKRQTEREQLNRLTVKTGGRHSHVPGLMNSIQQDIWQVKHSGVKYGTAPQETPRSGLHWALAKCP